MKPPKIVAEIGCNHMGDMQLAKKMITVVAEWCTDTFDYRAPDLPRPVVKFQKRCISECLSEAQRAAPHPNPSNSYGATYGEHREALEFTVDQHRELKEWCLDVGVEYACSVWDVTSAREIMSLYPAWIKIPSACNTDFEILGKLCASYEGQIHISTGMTEPWELEKIVSYMERMGASKRTILYACTSGYPVPAEQTYLREIQSLSTVYGHRIAGVGFSGHHKGIAIDMAAVAFGAKYIERHFTLDRAARGTDHSASLEPEGLRKLIRDSVAVAEGIQYKPAIMADIEMEQRKKLKRRTDAVVPAAVKAAEINTFTGPRCV